MQDDVIARNWRELIRPRRLEVEEDTLTSTIEVTGDGQVLANGQRIK